MKAGLDSIAKVIATERAAAKQAKARITAAKSILNALPTTFSEVLTTINAFTPTGPFEELAQDELAKLTAEFQALKAAATTAETSLSAITEF